MTSSEAGVSEMHLLGWSNGGRIALDFALAYPGASWSSCRQCLARGGERMTSSAAAGIEGFERLEVPTLVIRGRSTSPWLRGVAGLLAQEMPDAKLVELDGGHACILEHPEDFLAALGPHLDGAG